jgi:hypothetical protein
MAFVERAVAATDPDARTRAYRDVLATYGLHGFACGEVDLSDRRRTTFVIVEWPREWLAFYNEEGLPISATGLVLPGQPRMSTSNAPNGGSAFTPAPKR